MIENVRIKLQSIVHLHFHVPFVGLAYCCNMESVRTRYSTSTMWGSTTNSNVSFQHNTTPLDFVEAVLENILYQSLHEHSTSPSGFCWETRVQGLMMDDVGGVACASV